jgi:hypothetical protein
VPYRIALCLLGPTKQEKQKKKLVDAMGFSEFKLDPTKKNKTTSLKYIYNCKEKRKKKSPNYQIIWSLLRVEWSLWVL